MKQNLSNAIWKHKKLVHKAMPYFSTSAVQVDAYAAFYETDYAKPPEKSEQEKKFSLLQAKKRKEKAAA